MPPCIPPFNLCRSLGGLIAFFLPLTLGAIVEPAPPLLPRATVDISLPDTTGFTTVKVRGGGSVQAAIDSANCATVIELEAGATFIGPFTLPAKGCAAGRWIIIRSDSTDSRLPGAGVRITPALAALLPTILTNQINQPGIRAAISASYYRLQLLNVAVAKGAFTDSSAALIDLLPDNIGTESRQPHHIIVDRCLVRGSDSPPMGIRRGVALGCAHCAVINSYVDQIHQVGYDTQAIESWDGTGPWLVENNFLSASGENIMIGGADPSIPNALPSDIVIRKNHIFKPLSWKLGDPSYAGTPWTVKNLIEFKLGVRVLIEGNILENIWPHAQDGTAFTMGPSDNANGNFTWARVSDITMRYNKVINAQGGAISLSSASSSAVKSSQGFQRAAFVDNLFYRQSSQGGAFGLGSGERPIGTTDVLFAHNTVVQDPFAQYQGGPVSVETYGAFGPFAFHNNILYNGRWGVSENCFSGPTPTEHVPCWTADNWWKNLVYGNTAYPFCRPGNQIYSEHAVTCPVETVNGVGFVDIARHDYRLAAGSVGKNAATDGRDVGADINAVEGMTCGVVEGNPAAPACGDTAAPSAPRNLNIAR